MSKNRILHDFYSSRSILFHRHISIVYVYQIYCSSKTCVWKHIGVVSIRSMCMGVSVWFCLFDMCVCLLIEHVCVVCAAHMKTYATMRADFRLSVKSQLLCCPGLFAFRVVVFWRRSARSVPFRCRRRAPCACVCVPSVASGFVRVFVCERGLSAVRCVHFALLNTWRARASIVPRLVLCVCDVIFFHSFVVELFAHLTHTYTHVHKHLVYKNIYL